jgi:hypothetical protein
MNINIKKEMLVELIKTACWECNHQECIDCIFRYIKAKYNIVVPIQIINNDFEDDNEGDYEYKKD